MLDAILIVLASYLIGSVPVAYLTGRILRGIDIRQYGSRNTGASNIWQTVSKVAVVPVGLTEIGQGLLGIVIAKLAGQSLAIQVLAGLAALGGHNWSPFLGFTGGRGIAHAIGFMLVLSWPALGAFIGLSLFGVAVRAVPQFVGLAIVAAPFAAQAKTGPARSALSAVEQQVRHEILMLPFLGVFDHPTFRVEGSKVVLGGEVYRPSMKKSIERAIAKVDGVESIENNIEVLPTSPHDDAIRRRLVRAIYRHPVLDRYGLSAQPRILIIVKNGDVTL